VAYGQNVSHSFEPKLGHLDELLLLDGNLPDNQFLKLEPIHP
jgi:hypothetical protein